MSYPVWKTIQPPMEVDTPMGRGWAHWIIDYGWGYDDLWKVEVSSTRQFWTFRNQAIRGVKNYTFGVGIKDDPSPTPKDNVNGSA